YIQAEAFYRRSLEHYRAAHHLYGEADILIGIGRLQTKLGSYFEAITSLESANALQQQLGEIEGVAIVQYELARTYLRLNRLEEAKSAIEKTIDMSKSKGSTSLI